MPESVEVLGGATSVLFRGVPSSMWGTPMTTPVVAISRNLDQGDRRRVVVGNLECWVIVEC